MRKFIITMTVVFFVLSGVIFLKASNIPVASKQYQYQDVKPAEITVEPDDKTAVIEKENEANRVLLKKLQATIANLEDKLLSEKEETEVREGRKGTAKASRVIAVLGGKTFKPGQVIIEETLMHTVKGLVQEIMSARDYRIIIEGHTDNIPIKWTTGNRYVDNMELSFLRAKAVSQVLVEEGISTERISVIGYGDTRPKDSNDTKEGRSKNRRVEVKLVPDDKEF